MSELEIASSATNHNTSMMGEDSNMSLDPVVIQSIMRQSRKYNVEMKKLFRPKMI